MTSTDIICTVFLLPCNVLYKKMIQKTSLKSGISLPENISGMVYKLRHQELVWKGWGMQCCHILRLMVKCKRVQLFDHVR